MATSSMILLSPATGFAATLTTAYNFKGAPDASVPVRDGLIMGAPGCLYGVSRNGGSDNAGAIFRSTPQGRETVIYSFSGGADGANPTSLLIGKDRNLYGTTQSGGSSGNGTVWKLALNGPCGTAAGTLTTLYSFSAGTDGSGPGNLVQASDGNLYGTTPNGGTGPRQLGTVFKISPEGSDFKTFYSFAGQYAYDGQYPTSLIRGYDGNLYGTAGGGDAKRGAGAIFKLTLAGVETVTHKFGGNYHAGSGDGVGPIWLTQSLDGTFYGATAGGNLPSNGGTLFKLAADGSQFSTFYGFQGGDDGLTPILVFYRNGHVYGATSNGGDYGNGAVFELTGGSKSTIHSFTGGSDGGQPVTLIPGFGNALYGATAAGGDADNNGTLFSLTP
jgi:uncharacterized repeat protein (TIGR03803 family)